LKRFYKTQKGFTIFEVLAALVILALALTPVAEWIPASLGTRLRSQHKTTGIFLAENKLEELRYQIFNDFDTSRGTVSPQAFAAPFNEFNYTVADNPGASLKTITVEVWHTEYPEDETILNTQFARR
jgi:prepilin-type N-terminal cleavage/methylation domain-containing protein